jgi:hypothetical protein
MALSLGARQPTVCALAVQRAARQDWGCMAPPRAQDRIYLWQIAHRRALQKLKQAKTSAFTRILLSFCVRFWQRFQKLKTENSFADQGAYC